MKIGIAGLGRMGAAIATRLLGRTHTVTVWNRTPQKAQALAAAGAAVAATARELSEVSDFIVTMLTDAAAIDATYHGVNGLLAGEVRGKLYIEMSTVRPEIETALKLIPARTQLLPIPSAGHELMSKRNRDELTRLLMETFRSFVNG